MNLAAALAFGLLVGAAPGEKEPWIVLVRADASVPVSWRPSLQEAAKKAAEGSDRVLWQAPPAVSLEEAELALGCRGWGPACAGQIATMMNATSALVVDLAKAKDHEGLRIELQLVSASGEPLGPAREARLPDRGARGLSLAQSLVASAIRGSSPTVVTIETDVPGAEVSIDGVKRGKTPLTLVDEIGAGEHKLLIALAGRAPLQQTIDVKEGEANPFSFTLGAGGPSPVEPTIGSAEPSTSVMPTVAWTTTAAGGALLVVALGLAGGYGYTYSVRQAMVDAAEDNAEQKGIVPLGPDGKGQQPTYKLMEDLSIPLLVGAITSSAVGSVLLGTGVSLLLVAPEAAE